ncbi:MAG: hypothetical protein ACYDAY_01500 [Candidatus Dormibacteria bacterium]
MGHVDEGRLRLSLDQEGLLVPEETEHLRSCAACQALAAGIRADADLAGARLSGAIPAIDVERALARFRESALAGAGPSHLRGRTGWPRRLAVPVAACLAAVMTVGFFATGIAQGMFTVFEPSRVVAVPVSMSDLGGLGSLSSYGDFAWTSQPELQEVASAAAAGQATGIPVLRPSSLPSGVPTRIHYGTLGRLAGSFTFRAAKGAAQALRLGRAAPPVPAGIDGTRLDFSFGPAVLVLYGDLPSALTGGPRAARADSTGLDLPVLAVVAAEAPRVTSTGATAQQLESYLLAQPGITPQLAGDIRSLGDPMTSLPIPVPVGTATSRQVSVQGAQGVLVGDNTGIGAGVVWEQGSRVYAVIGTLSQDQVLAVARSLH